MKRPWFAAAFLALAACGTGPIEWKDATESPGLPAALPGPPPGVPRAAAQCTLSVRTALDQSGVRHAVWWQLRADRTADLVTATSRDGKQWSAPLKLDTLDVGKVGCFRQPPAITADGSNIHVVYWMFSREGPGVFLTHSMDGGAIYHSPVAVVYGARPGRADVAAKGNFVVVAYEDPNTSPTRISVAVSTTMAHIFQFREIVSPDGGAVIMPRVTTDGGSVSVSWVRAPFDSASVRITRKGTVR